MNSALPARSKKALPDYVAIPASLIIHLLILLVAGLFLTQKAEYGMEVARNSVEVNLVAAAPSDEERSEASSAEESIDVPEPPIQANPDDMLIPQRIQQPQVPNAVFKPKPVVNAKQESNGGNGNTRGGDGSSAVPGNDSTTLKASRGSDSSAKADAFRNIPPAYPESSRRAGHQGRVVLRVQVNAEGKVSDLSVRTSSGYSALDEAALKGVKRWTFTPAKSAGLSVSSEVDVPIRFQLD